MTAIEGRLDSRELARRARSAAADVVAGGWRRRAGGGTELRSGVRLAADPDHEVWLLCWPIGSSVTPHDHGESAGAFTVLAGELTEVRWRGGRRVERVVDAGQVVVVDRGTVHDVVSSTDVAYSVHVYSPPLSTMSFYDEGGMTKLRTEAVSDTPAEFHEYSHV